MTPPGAARSRGRDGSELDFDGSMKSNFGRGLQKYDTDSRLTPQSQFNNYQPGVVSYIGAKNSLKFSYFGRRLKEAELSIDNALSYKQV
ncbi:MAG: hypothetical protein IPJ30_03390 [Acidobacteria bacterium]|nr:hypothetical protein [Acidobacteriota bacterium]